MRLSALRARVSTWLESNASWLMVPLLVAGYAVRMWQSSYELNSDELLQMAAARTFRFSEFFSGLPQENHPLLSYAIRHFMLAVSEAPQFQRLFGIVPGLLLIIASYRLGIAISGSAGGVFAALAATFAPGIVLQSQISRHYALLVLLLTVALSALIRLERSRSTRARLAFIGASCASILVHYSGWIVVASMLIVYGVLQLERGPWKQALSECLWVGLPALAAVAVCIPRLLINLRGASQWSYLESYFGSTAGELASSLMDIVVYQFSTIPAQVMIILAFVGSILLARKQAWLLAVTGLVVVASSTLYFSHLYPMGGRHSLYCFPFLIALSAPGVQRCFEKLVRPLEKPARERWLRRTAAVGVMAALPLATYAIARSEAYYESFKGELPLTRDAFETTLAAIEKHGPSAPIITSYQAAIRLQERVDLELQPFVNGWILLRWRGCTFVTRGDLFNLEHPKARAVVSLMRSLGFVGKSLWMLELGWIPERPEFYTPKFEPVKAPGIRFAAVEIGEL